MDNSFYKLNKISSPNKKSILKPEYQFIDDAFDEINKTPTKKNKNDNSDYSNIINNNTPPLKSPIKNKVSISNEQVTVHHYLSRSPIKIKKSKRLFSPENNLNNNDNEDIIIIEPKINDRNLNNSDVVIEKEKDQKIKDEKESLPESNFYESLLTTPNKNNSNGVKISNFKLYLNGLRECIEYPINKFDKLQEEFTIFIYNNYKFSKYIIYLIAVLLNILLIGYSLNYLGPIFGLVLLTIGVTNSISFFKSKKSYQLFRYEGKSFQSPNMSLIEVEYEGSVDKIPILKMWEPKFPSKILFNSFNPLNIVIMFKAGPNIEDFICFSGISLSISIMLYFIIEKYEEKINDEKIIFNQLVNEYNHYMRVKPITKNKSSITDLY